MICAVYYGKIKQTPKGEWTNGSSGRSKKIKFYHGHH